MSPKQIHIEVLHEGPHCIPCHYMAEVVASVVADYGQAVTWEKVVLTRKAGALRFDELSRKLGRLAPVPSIFIDGQLVFDVTPGPDELKDHLNRLLERHAES